MRVQAPDQHRRQDCIDYANTKDEVLRSDQVLLPSINFRICQDLAQKEVRYNKEEGVDEVEADLEDFIAEVEQCKSFHVSFEKGPIGVDVDVAYNIGK